jgi:SRSO17 transposase
VAQEHGDPEAIGIIDETSAVKQGDKTPGVQRQYLGCVGKQENGIVTVHVGYSAGAFHCLLDGDLFLPESWDQDRDRCCVAGIPDEVRYRPKTEIALELYDRARANGVPFAWLTFDEWYGSKPPFLRALDDRGQRFVGEIHQDFVGWIDPPRITHRRYRRGGRGRGRKTPRLVSGSRPAQTVEQLAAAHPALRDQAWETWRVKDGEKGPIVWQVKHVLLYVKDASRLPTKRYHLLVCYNPLTNETKYFLSNAPPQTPVKTLLAVAFSRWPIERCFQDHKGEVGLTHWEGRHWIGLKRHLILTAVSYLFLATACQRLRGKKSRGDGLPGACGRQCGRAVVVAGRGRGARPVPPYGRDHPVPPAPQRPSAPKPHQNNQTQNATRGDQTQHPETMPLRHELAL